MSSGEVCSNSKLHCGSRILEGWGGYPIHPVGWVTLDLFPLRPAKIKEAGRMSPYNLHTYTLLSSFETSTIDQSSTSESFQGNDITKNPHIDLSNFSNSHGSSSGYMHGVACSHSPRILCLEIRTQAAPTRLLSLSRAARASLPEHPCWLILHCYLVFKLPPADRYVQSATNKSWRVVKLLFAVGRV